MTLVTVKFWFENVNDNDIFKPKLSLIYYQYHDVMLLSV